jgi:hypothetical protein
VDRLALWHGGPEKADELLIPVPLHAAAEHRAVQHVERGKQGRCAIPLVVVGQMPQRPSFIGRPGCVRSSA